MKWFYLILVILILAPDVQAYETKEDKLLKKIEDMQQRMDELQNTVNELKGREGTEGLEERITEMEKNMEPFYDPYSMRVYSSGENLLKFETRDKEFQFQVLGVIMNDWTWQSADDPLEKAFKSRPGGENAFEDGTEFRRAQLGVKGLINDRIVFMAMYDFSDGDSKFRDVFMGVRKIPYIGMIRVGHMFEPFGLETQKRFKYTTFIEKSYPSVFAPKRNTGLRIDNNAFDKRLTWAFGVFRNSDDFGDSDNTSGDGNYDFTARVTGLPWHEDKGRRLLHLGLSTNLKSPYKDRIRYRAKPLVSQTVPFLDTGVIQNVEKIYQFDPEIALVYGPFSLQGEWTLSINDIKGTEIRNGVEKSRDEADFRAWYAYASYFLTGEHRPYRYEKAFFTNVTPKDNFYDRKTGYGLGAWQLSLRYSDIDLEDEGINGGELDVITLGLNWYLNVHTRVMLNYNLADLEREIVYDQAGNEKRFTHGDYDAVTMRLQICF